MKRNCEIDALRGIAVMLVLLAHFRALVPVDWAVYDVFRFEAGVPLFFAISGAVISGTLIPRLDQGDRARAIAGFYVRRAYRILPLAYLWLALGLLGVTFLNEHHHFGDLRANLYGAAAAVLNLANIAQAKVVIQGMGIFGPYWSLSLEEQFYLLFPLFLVLAPARHRVALLCMLLACLAALWRKPGAAFSLQDAFAIDAILFGILAFLAGQRLHGGLKLGRLLTMASLFLLLVAPFRIWNSGMVYSVIGLLSGLLVLLALRAKGDVPDPLGSLSWVGTRSYGLYLAHGPCMGVALGLPVGTGLRALAWIALTFAATECLYRWVEQPLIEAGRKRAHALAERDSLPAGRTALPT
jgi:peptidoglycan/LPS O-acetylase OafA/YrhL